MADRSGYIGRAPGDSSVIIARQTFEPTGIQTDFTFASGYTPGYIDVYLNGSRLIVASDYTATDGSVVGLTTNALNGDVLECVAYKAFNLGSVNSAAGNFTVGGNLTVDGTTTLGVIGAGASVSYATTSFGLEGSPNIAVNNITGVAVTFSGAIDVDGHTELDDVNVSGASTFAGAADFNGAIDVDGHTELDDLNVSGVATVSTLKVGTAATINSSGLDVVGIASVGVAITMYASSGIVSATSFYGNAIDIDGPYTQTVKTITQSATPTVDLSTGNYFTLTQNANVTSWTFSNPPASGEIFSFVIELANVTYTTTWTLASGTVKWPADTAPTLTASKTHLIIFTTDDGGTTYRASSIVDYTT